MIHCIASRCQPVTSLRRSLLLGGGISATCGLLRSRVQGVCARDATHSHKRGGRCATPGPRLTRAAAWPWHALDADAPTVVEAIRVIRDPCRARPLSPRMDTQDLRTIPSEPVDLLIVDVFARRWTGVGPTQFAQEDRPKPSMVAVTVSPVDDVGRDQRPIGPPDVRARILPDHAHAIATRASSARSYASGAAASRQ
jgi:hypothetical protein